MHYNLPADSKAMEKLFPQEYTSHLLVVVVALSFLVTYLRNVFIIGYSVVRLGYVAFLTFGEGPCPNKRNIKGNSGSARTRVEPGWCGQCPRNR